MLLIVTNHYDSHADKLMSQLEGRLDVVRLNSDRLNDSNAVAFVDGELRLKLGGQWIDNSAISCIYYRKPAHWWLEFTDEYAGLSDATKQILEFKKSQTTSVIHSYLWQMKERGVMVMPDPFLNNTQYSKVRQFQLAGELGLKVPEYIISSDKTALSNFVAAQQGKVIIKTVAPTGRHARALTEAVSQTAEVDVQGFDTYLSNTTLAYPVLLQRVIKPKTDLRVTVVGTELFAVALHGGKADGPVDIRFDEKVTYESVELPKKVLQQLRSFGKAMGLQYGAYDFVYSKADDTYYFLEVNPYGQYLFVEEGADVPVTDALARYFKEACESIPGNPR